MSEFRRLFKNTAYLIFSQQISKLINFFQVVILVRYLGKNDYGIWSLIQSLPAMFIVFADMGVNVIIVRKIARDKSKKDLFFQQAFFIKIFLIAIFIFFTHIFTKISRYESEVQFLILISSISYSLAIFNQLIISVFRAFEDFFFGAIINALQSVLFFLVVLGIVYLDQRLRALAYANLLVSLFLAILGFGWYNKRYSIHLKIFKLTTYIKLLKEAFPFALLAFINPIFLQIDIYMLSRLSNYESIGIYSVAYKIISFLYIIPFALKNALFPRFSALYPESLKEFRLTFEKACKIMALLGLAFSLSLFLLSEKVVLLVFSSEYLQSIIPLKILAVSIFFYYLRAIFSVTLFSSKFEYLALIIFGTATIFNAALDYFLIPRFNYTGAALASLLSEILIFIAYFITIRKKLFTAKYVKTGLKIVLSSIILGIALRLSYSFSIFIQIPIGIVLYMLFIKFLGVLSKEDYKDIKKLFSVR